MPELPEVETIVRELRPRLTGDRMRSIEALWHRSLCGDPREVNRGIRGRRIMELFRRGKYICLDLEGPRLTIHLRMSGRLLFITSPAEECHIRARLNFHESPGLALVDPRKFGRIRLWHEAEPFLPDLGPDPLDAETVCNVLAGVISRRAVKTVLLDQKVLAGIGNIYADESLFTARVHPLTPAGDLDNNQRVRLAAAVSRVLREAIRRRGTTLSDYRDPDSRHGGFQHQLKVYQCTGRPCPVCGTTISRIVVGQRGTHFCPRCQKK